MTGGGPEDARLRLLARLHGVQRTYVDIAGRTVRAGAASLLATLRALGVHLESPSDLADAVRSRIEDLWRRPLEPVQVAWDGNPGVIRLRLPLWLMDARRRWSVALEDGERVEATEAFQRGDRGVARAEQVEGGTFVELEFAPPLRFPMGYHHLEVELGGSTMTSLIVSAPGSLGDEGERSWGVFLPLYALRSETSWGLGDLTDLGDLLDWTSGQGGSVVATLPILSAFLSDPFEPSPYSPVSRLFWNEVHADVSAAPELRRCPEARSLLRSRALRRDVAALQATPLVDHRGAMAAKRRVLEILALSSDEEHGRISSELDRFARDQTLRDYASFRANCERRGRTWRAWPAGERDGRLPREGGNSDAFRYHLYAQWLMTRQMDALGRRADERGVLLYFDFPLGVHPDGYDVWRERDVFALDASAGAPPDSFFTGGQDWGFPPLHPDRIRERGYAYWISCLRHVLRHAGVLRIDHVMGFHRLYWVPHGLDARHGAYVRYRSDEFYAILALEAAREQTVVVGEDLGTVPEAVRRAMRRHGINRSYVLEMEVRPDHEQAVTSPDRDSLASLNTHDLMTFAAFWTDPERGRLRTALVRYLRSRGWLTGMGRGKDRPGAREVLRACLSFLAAGDARMLLVNLEDLWLERRPQNVPGTAGEHPNWRRPARYPFQRFRQMRNVTGTLKRIDELRRRGER